MIQSIALAGLIALAFGLMYQVSVRMAAVAAAIGALSWTTYWSLAGRFSGSLGWAEFAGGLAVGVFSELAAGRWKQPVLVFQVPAIIPFVPGFLVYESMLSFMRNQFLVGLEQAFRAVFVAGALAVGLAVATAVTRPLMQRGR